MITKQIVEAYEALTIFIAQDKENKYSLTPKVRLILANNVRVLKNPAKKYFDEYNAIVQRLGERNKDGSYTVTNQENVKILNIERNDILNTVTDVEITPVKYADIGLNDVSIDLVAILLETGLVVE